MRSLQRTAVPDAAHRTGTNRSVGPLELQPPAAVVIPGSRGFLEERVVDALVVDRRRFGSAVGAVVAHDEVAPDGTDFARVTRPLQEAP